MLQDLPHPTLGPLSDIKAPGFPIKFSNSPGDFDHSAPLGGQHNEEILGGLLGIEKKEIEKLKSEGII